MYKIFLGTKMIKWDNNDRRPVYLALCRTDEADSRAHPDSLGFGLLNCHLNGFGLDVWWNAERQLGHTESKAINTHRRACKKWQKALTTLLQPKDTCDSLALSSFIHPIPSIFKTPNTKNEPHHSQLQLKDWVHPPCGSMESIYLECCNKLHEGKTLLPNMAARPYTLVTTISARLLLVLRWSRQVQT